MKTRFKKTALSLAIVSILLSAANGNAAETANVSADSAERHGYKAPITRLVSVNRAGTASGNSVSLYPVLSANGRFVAFSSFASDLVTNDTNVPNIFVRDLKTGTTTLASVNNSGTGDGNSSSGGITTLSANGRFVAFTSRASDLVTEVDNNFIEDIFVRDLKTGTTKLASVNSLGTASGNRNSDGSVLSANGRTVAFYSYATDLVVTDYPNNTSNGFVFWISNIFARDLKTGKTKLVSVSVDGKGGNNNSFNPVLSANGRFVAFRSDASDLVTNDIDGTDDVFIRDLKSGTTTLVSVNYAGTASSGTSFEPPSISADGRFVAFSSNASDLVRNKPYFNSRDIYVRDLKTGITTLVSVNFAGTAGGIRDSYFPKISADGRFVTFLSEANDLVENDTNGTLDVFVRDLKTGTMKLVSINSTGTDSGNASSGPMLSFWSIGLSDDGRFVSFNSDASNLVANDTNGLTDLFVRDLKTGTTTLASINHAGTNSGNGSGTEDTPIISALSADGRFVAFGSLASDLVTNDTNGTWDVFVRSTRPLDRKYQHKE